MAKTVTAGVFSSFALNPDSLHPAYRQLYHELRRAMLSGRISPNTRLPATRVLAEELGVSRNTITSAFDLLVEEGYLVSRVGAGTFVAENLPEDYQLPALAAKSKESPDLSSLADALSLRGRALARLSLSTGPSTPAAFTPDIPAYDAFPIELWSRIMANAWRNISLNSLGYADPAGQLPLREAISKHLQAGRLVDCEPGQVIVTSGSQQSFDLIARLLLDPGDPVWIEEPGYIGARAALTAAGARLVPVPVDDEGINPEAGQHREPAPRMVLVAPSRQYPLGMTLSMRRREALMSLSRSTGAWIVEDDYDSEFRYDGRPLPALHSMGKDARVIYVGTFSKSLLPVFRLGYLVVPKYLATSFRNTKAIIDRHPPLLEQIALQEFMEKGYFASHIRRMRQLYGERQRTLISLLRDRLPDFLAVREANSGMHVVAFLRDGVDDVRFCADLAEAGVVARALSPYYATQPARHALILGFAAVPEAGLRAGVDRLVAVAMRYSAHEQDGT